jgi:para-nitrobenzyl esterase
MVPQNPDPYQEQAGVPARAHDDANGLNLNLWTPGVDSGRRPTLVWIHGGANITGSNSDPLQDGARLAAFADAVVVSVNYRLGVFGFLWLDGARNGCSTGNAAIHDLVAALRWVQDEIARFGGDPDNVTIAGQSAGAALVGTLLGVPAAGGLFHRAIMQSGTAERVATPAVAAALTREVLRSLDLDEADGAALVGLTTAELLAAQSA